MQLELNQKHWLALNLQRSFCFLRVGLQVLSPHKACFIICLRERKTLEVPNSFLTMRAMLIFPVIQWVWIVLISGGERWYQVFTTLNEGPCQAQQTPYNNKAADMRRVKEWAAWGQVTSSVFSQGTCQSIFLIRLFPRFKTIKPVLDKYLSTLSLHGSHLTEEKARALTGPAIWLPEEGRFHSAPAHGFCSTNFSFPWLITEGLTQLLAFARIMVSLPSSQFI